MEPAARLAASFICNTIKYWSQIHIKLRTLPAIFEEKLITGDEVGKVWNYLNVMIRQSIRWMNQLLNSGPEIVLCENDAKGKPNPNAVVMNRAKLHDVNDI